jgi:S-adenosyl-L-methionine hydrolase (adenosine-forming)
MQIITLTTDFGVQDYYVAMLKGAILCECSDLLFIDLTHNVKNYNIVQAAYSIKHTYQNFPKGTIHVVSVNNFYAPYPSYVCIEYDGHFFVGPDNGVFSLIFATLPMDCYLISYEKITIHTFKLAYAKAIGHIAKSLPLSELGEKVPEIMQRFSLQPITGETLIRGSVIHIDHFENVVLNITKELWGRYSYYRRFALFFKRHDPINELSTTYADVPIGENLCLFNSANHLEIAINMGKAASMLSLDIEDTVQIEFY